MKEYKVIDKELEEVWRAQQALLVLTPPPVVADSSDADEHDEDSEDSGVFAHYLAVIEQQGLNARAITLKLKSLDVAGQATVCPADLPEPCERESRGYPAAALGVLRKRLARVLTSTVRRTWKQMRHRRVIATIPQMRQVMGTVKMQMGWTLMLNESWG